MYLKKTTNETELEFSARITKVAREFSLSKPELKTSADLLKRVGKFTLAITTRQPDLAVKVISDALIGINNNVNKKMVSSLDRSIAFYSIENKQKLEDVELSLRILQKDQKLKTQARLAFLNEQKALAKVLDISKDTLSSRILTEGYAPTTFINKGLPYYLRGYLAIDKEIAIISSRETPLLFLPEALAIYTMKETILQDHTAARAREIASLTPIGTDTFTSVTYDIDSIDFESKTKPLLILILSVILGGTIGIFVLIIRNSVIPKE